MTDTYPLASANTISLPKANGKGYNGQPTTPNVAGAIADALAQLGVRQAFGVSGGAMATIWAALSNHPAIEVIHTRHEGGAAFAATEAHFASDRPVVVFTTAGPGITNALTGLFAAKDEGAKVIHLSACTSAPQRGRWAIQETSPYSLPQGGIFTPGTLFDLATVLECPEQLPALLQRLGAGLATPGGFVAHVCLPTAIQSTSMGETSVPQCMRRGGAFLPNEDTLSGAVRLLEEEPFAIWLGFGARHGAAEILELAEKTGAAVMCSPRGKGIFPETHPQFVGVTGLGGHESVTDYLQQFSPRRTLVLGTRLGEPTSFWSREMVPRGGFIHVDINPQVPGVAFAGVETFPVQADVKTFVKLLSDRLSPRSVPGRFPNPQWPHISHSDRQLVRPEILMAAIQQAVVENSDAIVLAESGNSFTWSTHFLRFQEAHRYRVSTGVGAMGHGVTGVIGAARGGQRRAVAIAGDGAMLMNCEISTAVKYRIPAVWIVLNDARYNMCCQGMTMLGLEGADPYLPPTDFVSIARGLGAQGMHVDREADLAMAIETALAAEAPFVVDVAIDPTRFAPSKGRNKGLSAQGVKTTSKAKTDDSKKQQEQVSFPLI